jgi:hypothetical protein
MQLHSPSTPPPRPSPKEAIPYSSAALRQDLERVRGIWDDCQASRDRDAIYGYLNAVYDLVAWWAAEGRDLDRARRALRLQRFEVSDREDPFAAIIRCTADPAKPTSGLGASGAGSCGTPRGTSRIRSPSICSSSARAASTPALHGSRGALGGVRCIEPQRVY